MSHRSSFRDDILAVAGDEPIEAIVIGTSGWSAPGVSATLRSWTEVADELDFGYDDGFGGTGIPPVYAWTPTRVIVVHEYDGATSVGSVPRNPTPGNPSYMGGGGS